MNPIKILILTLLLIPSTAMAQLTVTNSGAEFEVSYTEPSKNAVNPETGLAPPLEDLGFTTIYFQKDFEEQPTKIIDVPATSPTGGGEISERITIPITPFSVFNILFWATATDTAQPLPNESTESTKIQKRIDNWAPAPPG